MLRAQPAEESSDSGKLVPCNVPRGRATLLLSRRAACVGACPGADCQFPKAELAATAQAASFHFRLSFSLRPASPVSRGAGRAREALPPSRPKLLLLPGHTRESPKLGSCGGPGKRLSGGTRTSAQALIRGPSLRASGDCAPASRKDPGCQLARGGELLFLMSLLWGHFLGDVISLRALEKLDPLLPRTPLRIPRSIQRKGAGRRRARARAARPELEFLGTPAGACAGALSQQGARLGGGGRSPDSRRFSGWALLVLQDKVHEGGRGGSGD